MPYQQSVRLVNSPRYPTILHLRRLPLPTCIQGRRSGTSTKRPPACHPFSAAAQHKSLNTKLFISFYRTPHTLTSEQGSKCCRLGLSHVPSSPIGLESWCGHVTSRRTPDGFQLSSARLMIARQPVKFAQLYVTCILTLKTHAAHKTRIATRHL